MPSPPENTGQTERNQDYDLMYAQLLGMARSRFAGQSPSHTLQPTALVHEAYLKLAATKGNDPKDQHHLLAIASHAMRQVLVDHARKKNAIKRGGGDDGARVTLSDVGTDGKEWDVLELHDAIEHLAKLDPRQAQIIELRFFGGLTVEQTAEVLGLSERAVYLDWKMARAWIMSQYGIDGDG